MKTYKAALLILLAIPFIFSCQVDRNSIIGTYSSVNNVNTIDTLRIRADGSYVHDLYRKSDNSLVYRNTGTWQFERGSITFFDFYIDADDVHTKEEGGFENLLVTTTLPVETKSSKIIFHHIAMYDNIYLIKID